MRAKKNYKEPSRAGKTSLRGTGCLSATQAGEKSKKASDIVGYDDWRSARWMERLKADMARAERYFWRQTAERQNIFESMAVSQNWGTNNFCFGRGSL
jgi:hypothetical protein